METILRREPDDHARGSRRARLSGKLIRAIELANPDEPVTLDILFDNQSIETTWNNWLKRADALYERHAQLFYEVPELATQQAFVRQLDLSAIMRLTKTAQGAFIEQRSPWMSAALGLGIMQFAEAGRQVADGTEVVAIQSTLDKREAESAVVERCRHLGQQAFKAISGRVKGSFPMVPSVRLEYLGQLLNMHYAFWTTPAVFNALDSKQRKVVEDSLAAFQAKVTCFDVHSMAGRPPREVIRRAYIQRMQRYYDSYNDPSEGIDAGNVADAAPAIFGMLNAARRRGYSRRQSLQHAVSHSAAVGQLMTERARLPGDASQIFSFSGGWEEPEVRAYFSDFPYSPDLSSAAIAKLNRRDQKGGVCPARWSVSITKRGETYQNLVKLATGIEERIGVSPPIITEYGDDVTIVNPSALVVNYILLGIADSGVRL